jgi:hypothetical protein
MKVFILGLIIGVVLGTIGTLALFVWASFEDSTINPLGRKW